MEQYSHSQYLMWMRSKHILNSHFQASMNSLSNSWEEQAFAEDAAGPLGGFVWPPRSYSCSFCKREFRSAQALGGHMNVHRRDRARLKQSLTTPSKNPNHHPSKSLDAPNPSHQQICTLESNPDPPNSNPNSTQDINFDENTYYVSPPFTSSINVKELIPFSSSTPSRSDNSKEIEFSISDSRKEENTILGHDHDYVETSLSVGLNLVASQNQPIGSDIDQEAVCYKRHKKTSTSSSTFSSLPFFLKHPCSSDTYIYPYKSEVLGLRISTTSSMDDIDLELRLGDPPKVK